MKQQNIFDGRIYFRLLAAVAAADGKITDEEVVKMTQLLELAGTDSTVAQQLCSEALGEIENPLQFLSKEIIAPWLAHVYLRDALFVAFSDGDYDKKEKEIIENAAKHFGVIDSLQDIENWVGKSIELQQQQILLFTDKGVNYEF